MKLEGLSEKIFIDRYAVKELDKSKTKIGDTVIAIVKDDGKNRIAEVGEITELDNNTAKILLRSGNIIDLDNDRYTVAKELTPDEMWDRVAKNIASVEKLDKQKEWEEKFRYALDDWKLVPGGRIAAGAGYDNLTMFNCYVIPSPKDSRQGIMESVSTMVEIMARGGGVGCTLSTLRPKRTLVKGVSGTSSGSVSWGGLYSYATGLVEQGGSRRGK